MKRRQLKIDWTYETVPQVQGADCAIPNRPADFQYKGKHYWFNEMRSLDAETGWKHGKPISEHAKTWVMDECPRTGAIMVLNPIKGSWHIQPKPVLDAYQNWLMEHFFME